MRDIYIPNTETWVNEYNNAVIGFINLSGNEIRGFFVLPHYHLKGIGTQLVHFVNELHGELDVEVFEKNVIGKAFYKKYGFEQIERYYHSENKNDVLRLRYKSRKASVQQPELNRHCPT